MTVDVVTLPPEQIRRYAESGKLLAFTMGKTIYLPGDFSVERYQVVVHAYSVGPCRGACERKGEIHTEATGFSHAEVHYLGVALQRAGLDYEPAWLLGHEFQHRRGYRH